MKSNLAITRRFTVLLFGLFISQTIFSQTTVTPPPNIVFIIADDLGWMDVGYNGQQFYETPNIDRLAKEGKTLQQVLLGRPALVTVAHKEGPQGVSARVEDIGACPAKLATTLPDPHNEPWSYDPADPDTNWDRLPPWQQEEVRNSIEFKEGGTPDETDDANM